MLLHPIWILSRLICLFLQEKNARLSSRKLNSGGVNSDVNWTFTFLYPWVYSSQWLKAIKTELQWLLVRIVLGQECVVQKNCIETLQCHIKSMEQERSFCYLARHTANLYNQGRGKVWRRWAKRSQVFCSNRLELKPATHDPSIDGPSSRPVCRGSHLDGPSATTFPVVYLLISWRNLFKYIRLNRFCNIT